MEEGGWDGARIDGKNEGRVKEQRWWWKRAWDTGVVEEKRRAMDV